jgi:hypothetical protein
MVSGSLRRSALAASQTLQHPCRNAAGVLLWLRFPAQDWARGPPTVMSLVALFREEAGWKAANPVHRRERQIGRPAPGCLRPSWRWEG